MGQAVTLRVRIACSFVNRDRRDGSTPLMLDRFSV